MLNNEEKIELIDRCRTMVSRSGRKVGRHPSLGCDIFHCNFDEFVIRALMPGDPELARMQMELTHGSNMISAVIFKVNVHDLVRDAGGPPSEWIYKDEWFAGMRMAQKSLATLRTMMVLDDLAAQ